MDDSEFSYIIKMKQTSNVQETCLQIVITHWTVSSLKTTKKTNLDQQISKSHWTDKTLFSNPILLNIENNEPFLPFPLVL
jgi:hypothetical protein